MRNKDLQRMPLSAFNLITEGDEATIDLYGEIVETAPIDPLAGEPIKDGYIVLSDILPQLDALAGKQRVTVHINTFGGDLISGIAIYNRLKSLPCEVITVCDSLAASAGSIIFQAGKRRCLYASSAVMVHHALAFMLGMCNAVDLRAMADGLDGYDRQIISVYHERTGLDGADIVAHMDEEKWMVGQEAVEAGYADAVIAGDAQPVVPADTPGVLNVGELRVAARWMPQPLPVIRARDKPEANTFMLKNDEKGRKAMGMKTRTRNETPDEKQRMNASEEEERKTNAEAPQEDPAPQEGTREPEAEEITTVEQLREAYPDLVEQIEEEARRQGAEEENARLAEIEEIESEVDDPEETSKAKYGGDGERCNASDLLLRAAKARAGRFGMRARMARETASASKVRATAAPHDAASAEARSAQATLLAAVAKLNEERK